MRALLGAFLSIACAAALASPSQSATAAPPPDVADPLRILVIGDSATHGSSGDWTWRYRLARHLEATGVEVDFVGPRDDVKALGREGFSHEYEDPDFDRDHASGWGAAFGFHDPIGELVSTYHPDVVVEMLGINNLTWLDMPPEEVDGLLRGFIRDARAADPGIDMVLSTVLQTWFDDVTEFNRLMTDTVAELDTSDSPLAVARSEDGYRERAHTWDPGHPNAAGEYRLAAAVQDALVELGVGTPFRRPLPVVPLGPRRAPQLTGTAGDGTVALTWQGARVATSQIVQGRDRTAGTGWSRWGEVRIEDPQRWSAPVANGHRYEFRLRPVKGYQAAAVRSNVVTLAPGPAPPRTVRAAGSPFGRAVVSWSAVAGADAYQVRVRRVGATRWRVLRRVSGRRTTVHRLAGRARYEFGVRTWRAGAPGRFRSVTARIPPPRPVTRVRATSPRRDRVRVVFDRRPEATGHRIGIAAARSCRSRPTSFRVARTVARPPVTVPTRSRALWVRVVAVRAGVPGRTGPGSTTCVRVR